MCVAFYIFTFLQELVVTSDSNLMKSLMYMFTMMMSDALEDQASAKDPKNVKIWIVV